MHEEILWNSRWWFQPNFEKWVKIGIFPKEGWKRKNIWNHHLELYRPKSMPSLLAKHALRKPCRNSCNSVDGNETFHVKKPLENFPTCGWYQTLPSFYMVLPIVNSSFYIFLAISAQNKHVTQTCAFYNKKTQSPSIAFPPLGAPTNVGLFLEVDHPAVQNDPLL